MQHSYSLPALGDSHPLYPFQRYDKITTSQHIQPRARSVAQSFNGEDPARWEEAAELARSVTLPKLVKSRPVELLELANEARTAKSVKRHVNILEKAYERSHQSTEHELFVLYQMQEARKARKQQQRRLKKSPRRKRSSIVDRESSSDDETTSEGYTVFKRHTMMNRDSSDLSIKWIARGIERDVLMKKKESDLREVQASYKKEQHRKKALRVQQNEEEEQVGQSLPVHMDGTVHLSWRPKWLNEREDFHTLYNEGVDMISLNALKKSPSDRMNLENVKLSSFLSQIPYFQAIPKDVRNLLPGLLELERHPANAIIFSQGTIGSKMYIVLQGQVRLSTVENTKQKRNRAKARSILNKSLPIGNEYNSKRSFGLSKDMNKRNKSLSISAKIDFTKLKLNNNNNDNDDDEGKILCTGDVFGMRNDSTESHNITTEMLKMTAGQRLWRKVSSHPFLFSRFVSPSSVTATVQSKRRTETACCDTDVALIKISFDQYDQLVANCHQQDMPEIARVFLKFPLFQSWQPRLLNYLAKAVSIRSYKAGEIIMRQGQNPNRVFMFENGRVDIIKDVVITFHHRFPKSKTQWQVTENTMMKSVHVKTVIGPELFGEESVFSNIADFTVRAVTKIRCLIIERKYFMRLFQEQTLRDFSNRIRNRRLEAIRSIYIQQQNSVTRNSVGLLSTNRNKTAAVHSVLSNFDFHTASTLLKEEKIQGQVLAQVSQSVDHIDIYKPYEHIIDWQTDCGINEHELNNILTRSRALKTKKLTVDATYRGRGSGSIMEVYFQPVDITQAISTMHAEARVDVPTWLTLSSQADANFMAKYFGG